MKQNGSETESNWYFRKNVKRYLQNKKLERIPPSRHDHFQSDFNFACKDG